MNEEYLDELFGILHSSMRLNIIKLLLFEKSGFRFNQISKKLKIHPSTLENHLKKLSSFGLITHVNEKYRANLNSEILWFLINKFQQINNIPYFTNHRIAELNSTLLNNLLGMQFEILAGGISIASRFIDDFKADNTILKLGGAIDFEFEKNFMKIINVDLKNTKIEIILYEKSVNNFLTLKNENLIFKNVPLSNFSVHIIDKTNISLMILAKSGFLFLPDLDFKVDFKNCIYLKTENGVKLLLKIFNTLKQNSELLSKEFY
ncbi:MAG: ArsR/SmtB family transcription factor [Candidatus Helarchaeota archaeon]